MPRSSQYSVKAVLANCVPLSVMILLGTPKRVIMFFVMKRMATSEVILATGSASIHLVKVSMATNRNLSPPVVVGKGPRISSPQTAKGHDRGIVYRG